MSADRKPFDWVAGVEAQMRKELLGSSDDALAALLAELGKKWSRTTGLNHEMLAFIGWLSKELAARGVVVLPPEPSEAMNRAAFRTFYGRDYCEEDGDDWDGISEAVRAALAVLREPTQRLT